MQVAAIDLAAESQCAIDVARENRGGQAVFGIVRQANRFIQVSARRRRHHRAEKFISAYAHLGADIG